ncbi:unnamed protein product [Calypogeia fissa]
MRTVYVLWKEFGVTRCHCDCSLRNQKVVSRPQLLIGPVHGLKRNQAVLMSTSHGSQNYGSMRLNYSDAQVLFGV